MICFQKLADKRSIQTESAGTFRYRDVYRYAISNNESLEHRTNAAILALARTPAMLRLEKLRYLTFFIGYEVGSAKFYKIAASLKRISSMFNKLQSLCKVIASMGTRIAKVFYLYM
jgi:hypothetical protein